MKKIWIFNHYASIMFFNRSDRHYNFAKCLKKSGYEPVIFCANAKHGKAQTFLPDTGLWQERMAEEIGVPFVFVHARTYEGNGKQRVLNMIDFYRNVKKTAREYAKKHGKPDIIYASSVHPLTLVAGIQLAKHFGVKCICEVRDMWPESIVAYSDRFTKRHPLIRLLYQGEKWIYKKADALIFTMEGAYDYIVEQGWDKDIPRSKVYHINNGVDLEAFRYNREHYPVEDTDLNNPEQFNVVYTGSIRLDGRELREVDPDCLYDLMSLIGQNVFLFDDTIWRNITMFRDFPEEQVKRAVKDSGLTQLISQKGKDYLCGENGVNLSGGERQRVSIARSLLRGTPVLLLDEATAALDSRTAWEVTDAILSLEGLTRLVVTHRLEAPLLERYDGILVLRNGRLWERGTYRELMDRKGYFYSLYTVSNG